ncbi:MAG TPA: hypothetical protein VIP98_14790 [Microlunatus sp.]
MTDNGWDGLPGADQYDLEPSAEQDQHPDPEQDHEPTSAAVPEPPRTGEPAVDQALDALRGLESSPLDEQHDRLARVHEELHRALNAEHSSEQDGA